MQNALGFILSSHRTEASWERYQKNIADARAELAGNAPAIDFCDGWHDHPLFVQSWVELIESALNNIASWPKKNHAVSYLRRIVYPFRWPRDRRTPNNLRPALV